MCVCVSVHWAHIEVLNHIEPYNKANIGSISHYFHSFERVSVSALANLLHFCTVHKYTFQFRIELIVLLSAPSSSGGVLCFSRFFIWCFDIESISRHFLIEIIFNLLVHPQFFSFTLITWFVCPLLYYIASSHCWWIKTALFCVCVSPLVPLYFSGFFLSLSLLHYYAYCMLWKAITQ